MKNMVEVILDDEKITRMGQYTPEIIHASVDNLFVNQAGMVKEGNFYVDYHPYNCMGIGMDCIMELAGKQWFRDSVKEMRWYRDIHHYGPGNDYHVAGRGMYRRIDRTWQWSSHCRCCQGADPWQVPVWQQAL